MKNKTTLLIFCCLLFGISVFSQEIAFKPKNSEQSNQKIDDFDNVTQNSINQKLPYPVIFIHGLNSNSSVWIDLGTQLINSGLSFGGRIDFCLNDDGNNLLSNKNLYPASGADIALYTNYNTDLSVADFYLLNFNIDNFGRLPSDVGFQDVLSNEAAIVKQGVALKYAIQIVLQKTGRDKVILMGHSMGGLASREYLQNPINWQPDGNHHVAKLITTGTPHGGYTGVNASALTGIDEKSEAYRDLKKDYTISGSNGVYLYGGYENYATMNNNLLYDFYNVDVNCNGIDADNTDIVGLNEKPLYLNLDYAYIVGNCTNCTLLQGSIEGDGIVRSVNANLSNFYTLPTPKNEFIHTAAAIDFYIGLHSDLPKAIPVSMKGLDEPNEYPLSYDVGFNQEYKGFITEQPVDGYSFDFDDYKFVMPGNGNFNITINNTYSNVLSYRILDSALNVISSNIISGNSSNVFNHNLNSGQYYLEFYATPSSTSYQFPYSFTIQNSLSIDENIFKDDLIIYPNPTSSKIFITSKSHIDIYEVYNALGQKVKEGSFNAALDQQELDLTALQNGLYILNFKGIDSNKTVRIIKQ